MQGVFYRKRLFQGASLVTGGVEVLDKLDARSALPDARRHFGALADARRRHHGDQPINGAAQQVHSLLALPRHQQLLAEANSGVVREGIIQTHRAHTQHVKVFDHRMLALLEARD